MPQVTRRGCVRPLFALLLLLIAVQPLSAQSSRDAIQGAVLAPVQGITESVGAIMERDRMQGVVPGIPRDAKPEFPGPPKTLFNPAAPAVSQWPPQNGEASSPALNPQTVGTSFLAIQQSEAGFIPPDSMGSVGPTQVLVVANGRIKVFDKAGVLGPLNTTTNNFFASVGGNTNGTSDPHIRYDRLSGRWFVCIISVSTPNQLMLAVSSGSTITGTSSFTFFLFAGAAASPANFADYPTLGVDKFALYIGVNEFTLPNTFVRCSAFVINKANLIAGTLTLTAFRGVGVSSGIYTPQGADNDDPQATEGYFIGVDIAIFGSLGILRVTNPGGTPTLSAQFNVTVPTTYSPLDQVQPSPAPNLDAVDDRLFAAQLQTNTITASRTLWTAHNIRVNTAGVGGGSGTRNASRWYEIGSLTTTPTLVESGTLFDPAATNPFGYWIPSIAMSRQGHAAIGVSRASLAATGFASVSVAGRLRSDALGTTQAATLVQSSTFPYDVGSSNPRRWGDYSQTAVDPIDGQTMWTFQEYANATNSWGVRVVQLRAPAPVTPSLANPASVVAGLSSVNVTITGTSISGSEFFDPGPDTGGPGFANRIAASISGGVTVNSVTFNSPTQVTLNISTVGAPLGSKNVTITNPDGQSSTGNGILTVIACPAPTPTISAGGPTTFCQGGSVTLTSSVSTGNQWYRNNTAIGGATSSTYSATLSGNYTVVVTDVSGCSGAPSAPTSVTVNPVPATPTISAGGPTTFCQGGSVTLSSSAASGNQWYLNGNPIGGATNQTYSATTSGNYTVIVTLNSCSSSASAVTTVTVNPIPPTPTITPGGPTTFCQGGSVTLTSNAASGNQWYLGVSPISGATNPTYSATAGGNYTVVVTLNSCSSPASAVTTVTVNPIPATPVITATLSVPVGSTGNTASATNHNGSTYTWTLTGGTITSGQGTAVIQYSAGSPGNRMSFSVVETSASGCASAAGTTYVMVDFLDVPPSHVFHTFVIKLARDGITAGCGGGNYCPNTPVSRAQMAVFLLASKHYGTSFLPPPATGTVFADVAATDFAAAWIEDLYAEGITSGCATNPLRYCPTSSLSRAQMSVFLLVGEHGPGYTPPQATGTIFNDVPLGSFAAAWIERLYNEGITGGCSTNPPMFCPNDATTRGQMAVFLVSTFSLP